MLAERQVNRIARTVYRTRIPDDDVVSEVIAIWDVLWMPVLIASLIQF